MNMLTQNVHSVKIPNTEHFIQEVQPEFLMGHLRNFFGQNITKTE